MKELSIEEKAKAYDKALEIMKAYYNRTQFSSISDSKEELKTIEKAFPELKESEDERIRKELLNAFQESEESLYMVLTPHKRESFIAWLEKQGKNNMGISEATKQKLDDNLNKALEKETPESWNEFFDEQGEQKQVIDHPDSFSKDNWELVHEFVSKFGRVPKDEDELNVLIEYVLKRQKPAWSEEDESHIRYLIECLEHCKKGVALKMTTSTSQEYINWLKSLRPQSHWKPTEEQMEAVRIAAEIGTENNSWAMGILKGMYQDLKKLREE